jgi:hypothetical protein
MAAVMNDEITNTQRDERGDERFVRVRSRSLKGGLDAAELGRRSGEARRARKARAKADAELDSLTVEGRVATILARTLTAAELTDLIGKAIERAKGDGHVANAASGQLVDLALRATRTTKALMRPTASRTKT